MADNSSRVCVCGFFLVDFYYPLFVRCAVYVVMCLHAVRMAQYECQTLTALSIQNCEAHMLLLVLVLPLPLLKRSRRFCLLAHTLAKQKHTFACATLMVRLAAI